MELALQSQCTMGRLIKFPFVYSLFETYSFVPRIEVNDIYSLIFVVNHSCVAPKIDIEQREKQRHMQIYTLRSTYHPAQCRRQPDYDQYNTCFAGLDESVARLHDEVQNQPCSNPTVCVNSCFIYTSKRTVLFK